MNAEARAARNAYKKEWNRRNPDKVRKYQTNYWNRKAEELKAATERTEGKAR